ncbi:MAG TPA: S8 family serine peptidase [Stellaceae bacterium]|nr:S8 family serine peptidase [Stellaceae bacterium]
MATITINGVSVDPLAQGPSLEALRIARPDAKSSNYVLVQTKAPLTAGQRAQLDGAGAEILEYVPDDTYICRYLASDLAPLRALPFVAWVNVYMAQFKIAPTLLADDPSATRVNLLDIAPHAAAAVSAAPVSVTVVFQHGVSAARLVSAVAAAAGVDPSAIRVGRCKLVLSVPRDRLSAIAALDDVRHIEMFLPPRLMASVARAIMSVDAVSAASSLHGENQVVAVCDTGVDSGNPADMHPALAGRIAKLYALGRGVADDPNGHGTHVCGCLAGNAVIGDGTLLRGSAPGCRLVVQSVLDSAGGLGGIPVELGDLFQAPYENDGARIHSNSWGTSANGVYTAMAQEVDDFVWRHRDMIICFSGGNDGADTASKGSVDAESISSPACAKNCIAIGASESARPNFPGGPVMTYGNGWPGRFQAEPISSDQVADNPNGIAAFSSRGPAANARIKPDLVAPGTAILSARSRVMGDDQGWGLSGDPLYFFDGGSSMAAPLVSGCIAVLRQFLQQQGIASPSAALVKAALVNGAVPLGGQYVPSELGIPPDNAQGFGRVDLARTLGLVEPPVQLMLRDEAATLETGESQTLRVNLAAPFAGLKVTLAWTDLPGEGLQADLDLSVTTADGTEYHGNMGGDPVNFDRVNTIEQVGLVGLAPGPVMITVRAHRTVQPQNFALAIRKIQQPTAAPRNRADS